MSYSKRTWVNGEILDADKMNHLEQGVYDNSQDIATIDTELDTKANIDGSYEGMTVGNAEQLVSTVCVSDSAPYNFRTTGGSADVGDRMNLKAVVGGTVAWKQFCPNGDFSASTPTTGWAAMAHARNNGVSNGYIDFTLDKGSGGASRGWTKTIDSIPANHKVFVGVSLSMPDAKCSFGYHIYGSRTIPASGTYSKSVTSALAETNDFVRVEAILMNDAESNYVTFGTRSATTSIEGTLTCRAKNLIVFDLTAMFGSAVSDYAYTLESNTAGAGVALLKKYGFFEKDYYPNKTATLESVKTSAHKTYGFNAYDNTTGKAKVVGGMVYQITGAYTALTLDGTSITPDASGYFAPSTNGELTVTGGNSTTTCIHLKWDGERDGEWAEYSEHTYALDDVELRGIPKLDANNNLYYDGDEYTPDGTVTRKYGIRAYASGDATDGSTMITDGTNTVYKLTTPTTESADAYTELQVCDDFGTEEFVDAATRDFDMPVGHNTVYRPNLRAKLEMTPNSPNGDGDYLVRQTNGTNEYVLFSEVKELPDMPTTDGTYVLKCTVSDGEVTLSWVSE